MFDTRTFLCAVALAAVGSPLLGQQVVGQPRGEADEILNAVDEAHRQERIAVTGDLGLPPLPPLTADSPLDSILYADRLPYGDSPEGGTIAASTPVQFNIPSSTTGTGFQEIVVYQLPDLYDPVGTPHPLVVAYHGYGGSAWQPSNQSTLDEECNNRNWLYLSVTGLDDQLFGSPISQQNTEAGIQWMIDNYNVDVDRIYMVGFSAGGGIVTNFAARRRDPEGLMIAALGTVSATTDWTLEYTITPSIQAWMTNAFNFGGTPAAQAFRYQQASATFNDLFTYPPASSAVPVPGLSQNQNLGAVPTYVTYDTEDTITHVPHMGDQLESMVSLLGAPTQKVVVTGTTLPGPPSVPAPHSWAVLDEVDLFDFFALHSVERYPEDFRAQLDLGGPVSWLDTLQDRPEVFLSLDASADPGLSHIRVDNVTNAEALIIDAAAAGVTGTLPVRVTVENESGPPMRLQLKGFSQSPSRLKVVGTGELVTLVDSNPLSGSLFVDVAGQSTLDVLVAHDPTWTSTVITSPNPVTIGTPIQVDVDGPVTSTHAYLVVASQEILTPVDAIQMTAYPGPPALIYFLPLDVDGNVTLNQTVPNDPALVGVRFPTQAVTVTAGGQLESVSNLWGLYVD